MRKNLGVLSMTAALSLSWMALAQQTPATPSTPSTTPSTGSGTTPPSATPSTGSGTTATPGNTSGAASGTGGLQVISCTQRATSTQGNTGTTGTTAGSTGSQNTATQGTSTQETGATTGTAGSTATNTGTTSGNTTATGGTGSAAGTNSTGTGTNGAGTASGTSGSTGTGTGAGSTGAGSAGTGSAGTGTTGTAGSGTTGTSGTGTGTNGTGTTGSGTTGSGTAGSTGNAGTSSASTGRKTLASLTVNEVCFLDKAAASNQFEILSSQLALQKSQNAAVKKVAQMIIKDHQTAGAALKTLAAGYGAVPSTAVNTQQQALISTLKGQSGKNFDVTYLAQQVSSHNEAINLFRAYSQPSGSPDAGVRQFAAKILPSLTSHAQMILSAQKTVTGSTTSKPASGGK